MDLSLVTIKCQSRTFDIFLVLKSIFELLIQLNSQEGFIIMLVHYTLSFYVINSSLIVFFKVWIKYLAAIVFLFKKQSLCNT